MKKGDGACFLKKWEALDVFRVGGSARYRVSVLEMALIRTVDVRRLCMFMEG